jgi:asparagine synthase (glutamine-hydrolysing)
MCGIAGLLTTDAALLHRGVLNGMRDAIRYRGLDAEGEWIGEAVALCHARLKVIDLTRRADQPMADLGGRYRIVFNGEIYNYETLRADYAGLGARFASNSDTEVIVEGYRLKGPKVCEDLNGMFAFAIYDILEQTLFLARDRLGKKPLYWARLGECFAFASTVDAFRDLPGWRPELSQSALLFYGITGSFPRGRTIYARAQALPPGCRAVVSLRTGLQPIVTPYWGLDFQRKEGRDLGALLDEYGHILADAVRLRLRSDVPLALTFSGGVDSGTIAALAAAQQSAPIRCYTVDYHTEQDPSEETVIAREVASHLGFEWHYVHFDYHSRLLAELDQAYAYYDQPCSRISLVYSDGLYRAIKPHATVVLSGNGADELFTGYIGDERVHLRGLALAGLSWLRPLLRSRGVSPYLRLPLPQAYAETIIQSASAARPSPAVLDEVLAAAADLADEADEAGVRSALDLKMLVTLRYSSSDSNFRMPDISGLAAQVEVRSPFLDHRMVEFASRVPDRFKVANVFSAARNKFLPKKYYERLVPPRYAWSRKKGMGWNLRWDRSIARDPNFAAAFAEAWSAMDRIGIDTRQFRAAWQNYVADIKAGAEFSGHSKMMMNGLMLGAWLRMRPEVHVSRP